MSIRYLLKIPHDPSLVVLTGSFSEMIAAPFHSPLPNPSIRPELSSGYCAVILPGIYSHFHLILHDTYTRPPIARLSWINHIKFIQIKWCLVCGGWGSLCLNVLSGWWPAAAVCLMFAVQDILHWVNTPACCLLLVLTYHEQHCVETGRLGPNINVSRENIFCLARSRAVRWTWCRSRKRWRGRWALLHRENNST